MHPGRVPGPDVIDDGLQVVSRPEEPADALALERLLVLGRDDAAAREQAVAQPFLFHQLPDPAEMVQMGPGEDGQADDVGVLLHGGVDKMALLKGPKEIERELLRIRPVVEEGGFVPHVDHRCPADVTLENYKFYLKLKRQMFNAGDLKPHYEE